jgi:hypothetical protein
VKFASLKADSEQIHNNILEAMSKLFSGFGKEDGLDEKLGSTRVVTIDEKDFFNRSSIDDEKLKLEQDKDIEEAIEYAKT